MPNALSHRSNIEIEIYGMEGIPEEDMKEHERQKSGGKGNDINSVNAYYYIMIFLIKNKYYDYIPIYQKNIG